MEKTKFITPMGNIMLQNYVVWSEERWGNISEGYDQSLSWYDS